jgi:hypothetical protein
VRAVEQLIRTQLLQQLENTLDEPKPAPVERAAPAPDSEVVSVTCACGVTIEAPGRLAGKSVQCPQCSAAVSVPAPDIAAAPYREDGQVPADIKAKVLGDLDTTERVVWVGQPVAKLVLLRNLYYLIPTVILFVIALVWLASSLIPAKTAADAAAQKGHATQQVGKTPAPPAKSGIGILAPLGMLCVAAGFTAVPLARWYFATRSCYVLTSRRALVYKAGLFGPELESYPPLEVANMRRSDSWLSSGCGDLIFRTALVISTSNNRGRLTQSVRQIHYGFLAIAKIGEVERLVRETLINRFEERLTRAGNW